MQLKSNPVTDYFKGAWLELRRVTWPNWQVVLRNTVSVVIGIGIATLVIALVDYAFIHALGFFINR